MIFYMLLSIFLYTLAIPVFILSASCMIFMSFIHIHIFYTSIKFFCRLILFSFGIFPRIKGSFPEEGVYIIMMNHSSFLDIFLFPLVPRKLWSGVTAIENFNYPILSALLRRLKAIPIERTDKRSAINSIRRAEKVLREGIHIGILPEGSRTITGKMSSLKKGGFHMAINTETPILPVGISGAFSIKPKNRWWMCPGPLTINIGEPISISEYHNLGVDGLLTRVEIQLKYLSGETNENK